MTDCQHKQLILTSQHGTDGFPIYRCALKCGALFKVKPEEITVEFAATTTTERICHYCNSADWSRRQLSNECPDTFPNGKWIHKKGKLTMPCNLQPAATTPTTQSQQLTQDEIDFMNAPLGPTGAATTTSMQPCFTCEGEYGLPATRTVMICESCAGEDYHVEIAPGPVAPPREEVRALVAKWRKEVERIREQQLDREPGYRGWAERNVIHADELEAALAATPTLRVQPEHCHAGSDGDCDWKNCPQKISYQVACSLLRKEEDE